MNEELDSQLSAMFDDELPGAECELLARRLSRDEALKARWGRYAVIGAVIRAERGVVLKSALAGRVNAALSHEPVLAAARSRAVQAWTRLLAGAGLAAGVAAISILWLRWHAFGVDSPVAVVASRLSPGASAPVAGIVDSFVVPPLSSVPTMAVPPTELADYVVAHSAYSWPVGRGSLLSSLMVSEPAPPSRSARSDPRAAGGRGNAIQQAH